MLLKQVKEYLPVYSILMDLLGEHMKSILVVNCAPKICNNKSFSKNARDFFILLTNQNA